MYQTVEEFFRTKYPELVECLSRSGGFWEPLAANTISNEDLETQVLMGMDLGRHNSQVFRGALALAMGRLTGKVANPEAK